MVRRWMGTALAACAIFGAACDDTNSPDGGAADASPPDAIANPCDAIVDVHFSSVQEQECGITPEGPVYCGFWIMFDWGSYLWSHGDVMSQGTYSCSDGAIEATDGANQLTGSYDPSTDTLIWEGLTYEPNRP